LDRAIGQFEDAIVRQEEASGSKHLRNIGRCQQLVEDVVADKDVGREDQVERFVFAADSRRCNTMFRPRGIVDRTTEARTRTLRTATRSAPSRGQRAGA
jgi:hypothetical protein